MAALPPALTAAIDRLVAGRALSDLAAAARGISERYRAEIRDGRLHVAEERAALGYLAARLPATFAAIDHALAAAASAVPGFQPRRLLDAGAGPGTVRWAAAQRFASLEQVVEVEASASFRAVAGRLAEGQPLPPVERLALTLPTLPAAAQPFDLVVVSYVLGELPPETVEPLALALWERCGGVLVLVEPGTPAGFERLRRVRTRLVEAGAAILAPCPHAGSCPVVAPDWCHVAVRVERSRLHRRAKDASVPWEDEKLAYLVMGREAGLPAAARVIAPPRGAGGRIALRLCTPHGVTERVVTRRDGSALARARRLGWGDGLATPL